MQTDVLTNLTAWAIALLVYPGLLFAIALALAGEWLGGVLRPLFSSRLYRARPRLGGFLDPFMVLFKLLGRKEAVRWQGPGAETQGGAFAPPHPAESALLLMGAIAPLLALTLMPVTGNPVTEVLGVSGDLFVVLALLAVYPLTWAAAQGRGGGLSALIGAQSVGALLTGLIPTLLLLMALTQVAGATNLNMDSLLAAPQTPQQTFVRLLAGVALLVALPWWLGKRPSDRAGDGPGAAAYAGRLFQGVALAVLWSVLVLPAVGDRAWALVMLALGVVLALVAMRLLGERWWPTRRTADAANLVWAVTLPVAGVALVLSLL